MLGCAVLADVSCYVSCITRNAHAHVMPPAMGANNVRVHEE